MVITHCKCCCDSGTLLLVLCSSFCHCSSSMNLYYCSQTWTLLEKLLSFSFSATRASFLLLPFVSLPWSYSSFQGLPPAGLLWYDNMASLWQVYPDWTLGSLCTVLYPGTGAQCRDMPTGFMPWLACLRADSIHVSLEIHGRHFHRKATFSCV